ncbi:MAG: hypothetical protein RL693_1023, partial [Verrucomicrobiota bacterium]
MLKTERMSQFMVHHLDQPDLKKWLARLPG